MGKRLFLLSLSFLFAQSVSHAESMPDVADLLAKPARYDLIKLRQAWLNDAQLRENLRGQYANREQAIKDLQSGATCAVVEPSLTKMLQFNPFSFFAHTWAMRCADQRGDHKQAQRHEALIAAIAQAMTAHGYGASRGEAIAATTLLEIEEYLSLAGYSSAAETFTSVSGSDQIYYLVQARDDTDGIVHTFYFDNMAFLNAWGLRIISDSAAEKNTDEKDDEQTPETVSVMAMAGAQSPAALCGIGEALIDNRNAQQQTQGLDYLQRAANTGSHRAQVDLALAALSGHGMQQDFSAAVDFLLPAAEAQFPDAQILLAFMHETGLGLPRDSSARDDLLAQAAAQLPAGEAQHLFARYFERLGDSKNAHKQTVAWLSTAAAAGNAAAMNELAEHYENGLGSVVDMDKSVVYYRRAAEGGDAAGMSAYGRLFLLGRGVNKDNVQGKNWLQKAAVKGDARAQGLLGYLYLNGVSGVRMDIALARDYIVAAAEAGDARGQALRGYMYEQGTGVARDDAQALHWYSRASERGWAAAQYSAGMLLQRGVGGDSKREMACRYFAVAADNEYTEAFLPAAQCLLKDKDSDDDKKQMAAHYLTLAAKDNRIEAQRQLGELYRDGIGVEKNIEQARIWLSKAAMAGNKAAQIALQALP